MPMRFVRLAAVMLLVLFIAVQFVPHDGARDNPPSTATISGPPEVVAILRQVCFDCHSNETQWPFYSYVAPMSWFVIADVAGARSRMNFSEWEELRVGFQKRFARKIVERIEAGEMPLWQYRAVHWRARISPEQLDTLRAWRDELNPPTEK